MNIFTALLLGFVQGITEFIPVSSSGHLEIIQNLLGTRPEGFHYFLELINLGTLAALIIYFWPKLKKLFRDITKKRDYKLVTNIIITCIPAGLAGLLLSDLIDSSPFFSSLYTISIAMGIVGILMILSDRLPHFSNLKNEGELSPLRALGIGLAQVFALIPGTSRSGSTIVAGRVMGMDSAASAEYSFLVSIPLMVAVCLKTFLSSSTRAYWSANFGLLVLSNLVAFVAGLLAIRFVMRYLKRPGSLKTFGYYRVVLAAVVLIFLLTY